MSISLYTVAEDVWNFLKNPRLEHLSPYFKANPAQIFPYLLLLSFMMVFMLMIPVSGLLVILGIEEMDHKIADLYDRPWLLAIRAIILAPIIEEAVFRLPMKYSYVRIFAACCIVLVMLSAFIDSEMIIGIIAIVFFLAIALFHFIDQRNENQFNIQIASWWETHFYIPFWLLTICFALLHLTNFKNDFPLYVAPFLVLPQFVLGVMLGYIRVGFGFVFAVLFHALYNGVTIGLALMAQATLPST